MPVKHSTLDRNNGTQPAKRISLKSLMVIESKESHDELFEKAHSKLRSSTIAVFHNKPISYTLEELYRSVEDICAHKMVPTLYETLESLFAVYVNEILPKFLDENLQLKNVSQMWELYCKKMLMIRNIFLFLDRQLPIVNPKYISLWDLALNLFRDNIVSQHTVQAKISKQLLEHISDDRKGIDVDKQLLRSIVRMYTDLQLYQRDFQASFLRQTQQFFADEVETMIKQLYISDYLDYVSRRLTEEEERLITYLNAALTRTPLMALLDAELITKRLESLVNGGLSLILRKHTEKLHLLYLLLSRVAGGVDQLRIRFRQHVKEVGQDIVENPKQLVEKDKIMIQQLLDCRDSFIELIETGFCRDVSFNRALQEAYEEFLNSRPNKPAEYLAKYLDLHLRTGNKTQTDEELERIMDKSMLLFRFIDGKDIFEAFYTKELAKRLLLGKSASVDAEKAMLSKLKQECGPNYTRKMETMFQDIELSKQLSKNFRSSLQSSNSIDFNVNVISPASWPQYPQIMVIYPPEMLSIREEFTSFYLSHHQGRKLLYQPSLGTCVVRADFPTSPGVYKELQVSEFQALILMRFNGPAEAAVSYESIADATAIEKTQLDRTLLSLAAGKGQKVLIMKPLSLEIGPGHKFFFNSQFEHRLTRIKFNQIQLKETKQEQEETEEQVFSDRVSHVDCCIVRIMKTRKTMEHNSLLTEVYKQLQFPLKAADVKKRIENLIERDYLKRDSNNTATYHYVA